MAPFFLCLAGLGGCGGTSVAGVDSGGTGGGSAAFVSGPITGFGSVIVNGVRFDITSATLQNDQGDTISEDELKLGMTARIDAGQVSTVNGQATAVARALQIDSAIVGPVSVIDPAAGVVTVLGQPVRITPATVFDSGISGGLSGIAVGLNLEVFGQFDAHAAQYVATRLSIAPSPSAYKVRGIVTSVDEPHSTLSIGALVISYAGVDLSSQPPLTPGSIVTAHLAPLPSASIWTALDLAPGTTSVPDRPDAQVSGRVTSFVSSRTFSIDGVPVDASAAQFPDGEAGVALGARLEVVGQTSQGVLVASKVSVEGDEDSNNSSYEVHGRIQAVDPTSQTFTLRGVVVHYTSQVQFDAGTISDISVGRSIKVVGDLSTDGTRIEAAQIRFEDS